MFIYNFNFKKLKKFLMIIIASVLIILTIVFIFHLIDNSNESVIKDDCVTPDIEEIPVANYTNFLKDCYGNLDNYIRQKN